MPIETTKTKRLYCPTCGKHTPHVTITQLYATGCTICHTQTGQLERVHAATAAPQLTAPDGAAGELVYNTPKVAVFYVAQGEHRGYYHYDKGRKTYTIVQA